MGFSGFPEGISGRTGNTNVGTVSDLSTGIAMASESSLADPKLRVTGVGREFSPGFLLPVVELLQFWLVFPVCRWKFGPSVYAT